MFARCTQTVRSLHLTCPQMIKKKPTAGVGHQFKAYEKADEILEDPEGFGDFESDFMHVNQTHRQHEGELQLQRDQVRHIMVKQKYFKEPKLPALLLYAEKNEIRTLHARDPDEWTIDKLAESFPATPDIIKKVINSKYRPYSLKRIRAHDEAVIKNWERFRNGNEAADENYIPPELREHLLKFAKRTLQNTAANVEDVETSFLPTLPKPAHNEFSSIITSCKKYADRTKNSSKPQQKETNQKQQFKSKPNIEATDETYLIDKVTDKRKMRLQDAFEMLNLPKTEPTNNLGENQNFVNEEAVVVRQPENPTGTGFIQKFESNEVVVSEADTKKYEMTPYKDQIHIPRKLWRQGATYRVYDCYYDDDGEFLYRVPGMSGAKKTF